MDSVQLQFHAVLLHGVQAPTSAKRHGPTLKKRAGCAFWFVRFNILRGAASLGALSIEKGSPLRCGFAAHYSRFDPIKQGLRRDFTKFLPGAAPKNSGRPDFASKGAKQGDNGTPRPPQAQPPGHLRKNRAASPFLRLAPGRGSLLQFQCNNFTLREVSMQDDADGDAAPYHSTTNV
ncbi:hypothetical protein [Allofournierella sp.]|uniref:hypothetical protein n=1 Tax=Allofournierella sp. TaxID=1940256 RepID=UPI003AF5AFC0